MGVSMNDAVQKIITGQLAPLSEGIELGLTTSENKMVESATYGIRTEYLRNVYHASLRKGFEIPDALDICGLLRQHGLYTLRKGSDQISVYAWLQPQEFDLMSSPAGKEAVEHRLEGAKNSTKEDAPAMINSTEEPLLNGLPRDAARLDI